MIVILLKNNPYQKKKKIIKMILLSSNQRKFLRLFKVTNFLKGNNKQINKKKEKKL